MASEPGPPTSRLGPTAERIEQVQQRLGALRRILIDLDAPEVEIVAVTKGFGIEAVHAAAAVGLSVVGENYAQELVAKATAEEPPAVRWHFIGQLQSNKIVDLAPHVDVWQSIDRLKLGKRIAQHQPSARVFVQLRPDEAPADGPKGGCSAEALPELISDLRELGLNVDGIMTVGVQGNRDATRRAFDRAADLADRHELGVRSFGMSGDIDDAVRSGSTMIRVGTGLFGARPPKGP